MISVVSTFSRSGPRLSGDCALATRLDSRVHVRTVPLEANRDAMLSEPRTPSREPRTANRESFVPQRQDRIDACSLARGQPARDECHRGEQEPNGAKGRWIDGADVEEQV